MTHPWDAFDGKRTGFDKILRATVNICRVYTMFSGKLKQLIATIPDSVVGDADKALLISYCETAVAMCEVVKKIDALLHGV